MTRTRSRRLGLIAALAIVMLAFTVTSASASATGWVNYSTASFSVGPWSFTVPGGTLQHDLGGSGRTDLDQIATVTAVSMCYQSVDWVNLKAGDVLYSRTKGSIYQGCVPLVWQHFRYNANFPSPITKACAELRFNNVYKARQCHSVY